MATAANLAQDLLISLSPATLFKRLVLHPRTLEQAEPSAWQHRALRRRKRTDTPYQLYLVSRQGGKSSTAACKVLHTALTRPRSTSILVSPSLQQSREIFKKVADYYHLLGRPLGTTSESTERLELSNGARVISLPGSARTVQGYTANVVVFDESHDVSDELFETVLPMVSVTAGEIVAVGTARRVSGWFYSACMAPDVFGWEMFRVPASECPHIPQDLIEAWRFSRGEAFVRREFFCEFQGADELFFDPDSVDKMLAIYDTSRPPRFPESCYDTEEDLYAAS
jgi:hypothetical protein